MDAPKWELAEDCKTLYLMIPTEPPVRIRWDTAGVETLQKSLGVFRERMQPKIPATFAVGQGLRVEAAINPGWSAEPEMLEGNSLLHIRDARFGWLHFVFPRAQAAKLGDALQRQAAAPMPGPTRAS